MGELAHLIVEETHDFDGGDLAPYVDAFAAVTRTLAWAAELRERTEATKRAARKTRMLSELHRREQRDELAAFSDKFAQNMGDTSRHLAPESATPNSGTGHAHLVIVDTECPSPLGMRLIEQRGILDLTQEQLAEKCGVSRREIQRIESPKVRAVPQSRTATKLVNGMGVNYAWFMHGEGAKHGDDRSEDHAS